MNKKIRLLLASIFHRYLYSTVWVDGYVHGAHMARAHDRNVFETMSCPGPYKCNKGFSGEQS
jgi:hypothetical protein